MLRGLGVVSATLTGADQFTAESEGGIQNSTGTQGIRIRGYFNLSIGGTWSGRVTMQRSFDRGASWVDINKYSQNDQTYDQEIESGVLYRIGFKTGDYTSGTAIVRISK